MIIPGFSGKPRSGFSLIEVVIATAVFATAIVAIIGLMAPLSRRVEDVIDSETAARLAESIRTELNRVGFDTAVAFTDAGAVLELVANAAGDRVLILSGTNPAANRALDDATMPGIADRDRYFLIRLTRQFAFDPDDSGSLALRAQVDWPYLLPEGPPSSTTVAHDEDLGADESVEAPANARRSLAFFFAISP